MGVTDWEPRALPSEARCKAWAKTGGLWLHSTLGFTRASDRGAIPVDTCAHEFWRPWKDRQPALWSDFYAATHPPIPEGWEKVGEWFAMEEGTVLAVGDHWLSDDGTVSEGCPAKRPVYAVGVRRILPAIPAGWEAIGEWHDTLSPCSEVYDWTLLQDGRIVQRGETFRAPGERIMGVHIRRVFGAVDWGDVPRGVELDADRGGAMLVTSDGHAVTHGIVWFSAGVWHSGNVSERADQRHPSLPAAIVALTGRRE